MRAAYETYRITTYDAKYPDVSHMQRMLDFRLSQQPFMPDERHAYRALGYITARLRDAGIRAVQDYQVVTAAMEYIETECR